MSSNPYQSPVESSLAPASQTLTPGGVRVDGKKLVVRTGVVLPRVCIKTNVPVGEEEMERKSLTWCPRWVLLLIIPGLPFLLIGYLLTKKQCDVTFGMAANVRKEYFKWRTIKGTAAIITLLGMFASAFLEYPAAAAIFLLGS